MHWSNTSKINSLFSPADRLPPSLKPRKHFCESRQAIYGRLIQCRTGHAFTGEYYSSFVPSETVSCPCGKRLQTREHILATYPTFESKRDMLRSASEDLVITDILGTEKGIKALSEFLQETNAFKKPRTDPSHTNLRPSSPSE
ncbi:hypothetical protein EDD16DRAFT_1570072 [Pisolithus croceorrhizus]|nr:hypothetical protein EDD16DRAFT_1570072 [Pisolithus croceorrhizus]